jgi:hypothetical protein
MDQVVLPFLVVITLIAVSLVVVGSFVAFGGVQRNSEAQCALGSYGLVLGLFFTLVFLFPQARQTEFPYSDYYANNWLASGLYLWSGSMLLLASLTGFGLRGWIVLLVTSIHSLLLGLLVALVVPWKMPEFSLPAVTGDVGVLMALRIILAMRQQQGHAARQAIELAMGGVVLAMVASIFLGSYYQDGLGRNASPPVINGPVLLLNLVLGLLIFFVVRVRSARRPLPSS